MRRPELIAILDGFKERNDGVTDFTISVPPSEARAVNMSLNYLKADGTIEDYERYDDPDDNYFDIIGYTGE